MPANLNGIARSLRNCGTALAMLALLGSCDLSGMLPGAASTQPSRPIEVATVGLVSGANAHIQRNGGGEVAVQQGVKIYDGDRFWTGPGSELQIVTTHGQTITLYPNSDPILKEAACFTLSFFTSGKVRIDGSHICVNGQYVQASVVGYEVIGRDTMRIWVKSGQVRAMPNPSIVINAGEGATVVGGLRQLGSKTSHSSAVFDQKFPLMVFIL